MSKRVMEDGAPMMEEMVERNGYRERIRVAKACDICKRKKTKCDGEVPCGACQKYKRVCTYSPSSGPPAKIRRTDDEASPMSMTGDGSETLASLQARLRTLEYAMSKAADGSIPALPMGSRSVDPTYGPLSEKYLTQVSLGNTSNKSRFNNRYFNILPHILGDNLRTSLSSENQKLVTVPRIQGYGWNLSGVHYLQRFKMQPPRVRLDHAMERELIEYFFDVVNPVFALFNRALFMKQFEAYVAIGDIREARLYMAFVHGICAISMRFSEIMDGKKYESNLEEELFEDCYSTFNQFGFEWECTDIVQGLLLCTLYLRACHRQSSCWSVLGQALRLAYGLGLLKKHFTAARKEQHKVKCERIFWCCYVLDRLISIDMGRAFYMREEEITWTLPEEFVDDGWNTPIAYALARMARIAAPMGIGVAYVDGDTRKQMYEELVEFNRAVDAEFLLGRETLEYRPPSALANGAGSNAAIVPQQTAICHFRLQFHDLVLSLFQPIIYSLAQSNGLLTPTLPYELQALYDHSRGSIEVIQSLKKTRKGLNTAWWETLSSIQNSCMVMLLLLLGGYFTHDKLVPYISSAIRLMDWFAQDGRFAMSKECQWAMRTLNHMVCMKLDESRVALQSAGIDHGDPEVNKRHFAALGLYDLHGNFKKLVPNMEDEDGKLPTPEPRPSAPTPMPPMPQQRPPNGPQAVNSEFYWGNVNPEVSLDWLNNWAFDF
ncbi:hypothetical protein TRVA0_019S00672 [Trichomonascus vanleenenianus]|uniref:uncharacterized protein n=1 Tax=Trichomonascus vanleenenianus TaxID=2268995 RepID=UPI003ECBA69C